MRRRVLVTSIGVLFFLASEAAAQTAPDDRSADAPPKPEPPLLAADPPTSTSGSDVAPPSSATQGSHAAPDRGADADTQARIRALEARQSLDEAKLKAIDGTVGPLRNLKIQGYVQAQYILESANAAASPNLGADGRLPQDIGSNDVVARDDGTTTSQNRFRLRRTRLRTVYETNIVRVFLQLDFLPSGGPNPYDGSMMRNAEATGIARWSKDVRTEFTAGLFMVPFRYENTEISLFRPFIERTWANLSILPGERDIGAHAKTIAIDDRLVLDVGIVNGHRLGEPRFVASPDLNKSKDFFAMASYRLGPLTLSANGYLGAGANVDPERLRVKNYRRWGANFGAQFAHTFCACLGETRGYAELMFAENMDSGIRYPFAVPAIPARFTDDVKNLGERALYLRAEQDVTRWGLAGFRYDMYTTDTSIKNNARDTFTFMAGGRFTKYLRLVNEVGFAIDNIHAEGTPPPSKSIFTETLWLQGSFY